MNKKETIYKYLKLTKTFISGIKTKLLKYLNRIYETIKSLYVKCEIKVKFIKHRTIILSIIASAILLTFIGVTIINRDKSVVKVCESTIDYNKGIGLTFYVGKDGKTINKIQKNDTVSLGFIENNLTKENSKEILEEYKTNVKFIYEDTLSKYGDLEWFSVEIIEEEDMIKSIYTFNVNSKKFDYDKYKTLIEEFSLEYYYDIDEGKFIYDEAKFLSKNTPLGNIENISCYTEEQIKNAN